MEIPKVVVTVLGGILAPSTEEGVFRHELHYVRTQSPAAE